MGYVTRFAPSPTGRLHLGHAFAALTAEAWARLSGGRFLLRLDDLDRGRSRAAYEAGILEDIAWLGLRHEGPVRRQSDCMAAYAAALERLRGLGVLYPCFCTRAAIQAEISAMAGAPQGPDGPIYPGTCRGLDVSAWAPRVAAGEPHAWRIDVAAAEKRAAEILPPPLYPAFPPPPFPANAMGDAVLSRKETPASYHLAVVVDDQETGVTLVTRGEDLAAATGLHRLLQRLLGYDEPAYAHHRLILDAEGRRLAKRDDARSLSQLRADGATPAGIRALADWPAMEAAITNRLAASPS